MKKIITLVVVLLAQVSLAGSEDRVREQLALVQYQATTNAAAETVVAYAANPAGALAVTNWPAAWAAANSTSKQMDALNARITMEDALKKSKEKADRVKEGKAK